MEYLSGGSCGDLLKPGVFKEEYIAIVARELLKGLEYLHGEGKLHRDIKGTSLSPSCETPGLTYSASLAANVLLSANGDGRMDLARWTSTPLKLSPRSQARRLWSIGTAHGNDDQEEHLRFALRLEKLEDETANALRSRHTVLDGSRGHQAERIRLQGRHLVSRNHLHRDGEGRAPVGRAAPNEGTPLSRSSDEAASECRH